MSDLDTAYGLNGPDDCRRLYAAWAESYDHGFAMQSDYRLPAHVAAAFLAHGGTSGAGGAILDVGAGTGLLAAALRDQGCPSPIDGVDLSPQMLTAAADKGLYRSLAQADITQPFALQGPYGGIVSSGTFTHGHVGPSALPNLEALARPGTLFALSINAGVFHAMGFDTALATRPGLILLDVAIYGPAARQTHPDHAADRGIIALWRHPA